MLLCYVIDSGLSTSLLLLATLIIMFYMTLHVTLRAPTELTDWPLALENYVITHHVITYYYVAIDCWSTDSLNKCKQPYMSHRPTHRPTCGFQAVIRNATDARLATQSKNRNMQCMHAKNATHATDSILACVFQHFFVCVHCVHCGFLIVLHDLRASCPLRCIWQLRNWPLSPFS